MPIDYARTAGAMSDLVSQPVNSFMAARDYAQQNQRRNMLADQVAQRTDITWQQQQDDRQNAMMQQEKAAGQEKLKHALSRIQWALQSGNPKQAVLSDPGIDPQAAQAFGQMSDEQAMQHLQQQQMDIASQLGIGPPEPDKPKDPKIMSAGRSIVRIDPTTGEAVPIYTAPRDMPIGGGDGGDGKAPSGYRWNGDKLEPIPGGPADPAGPGARKNVQPLRKEFEGLDSVKNFKTSLPLLVSARKAPNDGYGDLQLIYTAGKILDPNSVVREGELALTIAAGSPIERVVGTTQFYANKGGRLTPKARQQLLNMVNERVLAYRQAYDQDRTRFATYSTEAGGKPMDVVGAHPANAYKQTGNQRDQAPSAAVEYLRAHPETKAAFKAKYGYIPDGI